MLVISQKQMSQLDAHMMRQYEHRVVVKIRKAYPDRFQQEGDEKVRLFVQAAIRKGESHAITEDGDAERFILLLFVHGLDFDKAPERARCRQILSNPEIPGDAKVSLIRRELEASDAATRR